MADDNGTGKSTPRIGARGVLWCAAFFGVAAVGIAAWQLWPTTHRFYTDADSIREPAATAVVRDILWQPPEKIPGLLNTSSDDYEPRISADGMTLYFVRGKAGENADIYTCGRTVDGWSEPALLAGVNSEYDELGPYISVRGDSLYFYSDRPGGLGGYDVWAAYRSGGQTEFGEPVNLGPNVNSPFSDYGPAIAPDGEVLYFASNRPQEGDATGPKPDAWPATIREDLFRRDYDLYYAAVTDAGMATAKPLTVLNTPFNEGVPAITPVGDFLYFSSDRQGGSGGFDLYRSRRLDGTHEPATNLGVAVNTPANELDPSLGMGGFGLYFSSDRATTDAAGETVEDYNLYYTASREVFALVETQQADFNWAALWDAIGLNLLWALLALLLAVLLMRLMRGVYGRRMSLLARCLLASMLAHLLLLFLFSLWQVTAGLADTMRRGGGVHITLAAPAKGDGIASQIRGGMTSVDVPIPQLTVVQREPTPTTFEAPSEMASLTVAAHVPVRAEQSKVKQTISEAARATTVETPQREVSSVPAPSATLDMTLPAQAERAVEAEQAQAAPSAQPAEAQRAASAVSRPSLDAPAVTELPTSPVDAVDPAATASLAGHEVASDVDVPTTRAVRSETPMELPDRVEDGGTRLVGDVALPPAPDVEVAESQEEAPTIPTAATSATRGSFVDSKPRIDDAAAMYEVSPAAAPGDAPQMGLTLDNPSDVSDAASSTMTPVPLPVETSTTTEAALSDLALGLPDSAEAVAESEPSADAPTRVEPRPAEAARVDTLASNMPGGGAADDLVAFAPLASPDIRDRSESSWTRSLTESATDAAAGARNPVTPQVEPERLLPPSFDVSLPAAPADATDAYAQRTATEKLDFVERQGGSEATEAAVAAALSWLARHQSSDGHWDGNAFDDACGSCDGQTDIRVDRALTGMSLLCFLAAGHTQEKDGIYRDNVARGVAWLIGHQKDDGDLRGDETMYSHGIATIAIAEAFGMTGDTELRAPVESAVRFIERARNRTVGGWRYDPGQAGDTSVLGWQIMALKSARMGGIDVSWAAFDSARKWLDKVSHPSQRGLYAYRPGKEYTPSMTAEGMFVQQILGRGPTEPRMMQSAGMVTDNLPNWEEDPNTYYWYYATLALFQHQGPAWERWNRALTEQLLANQRTRDGLSGSWDPVGEWAHVGGRVYQTAICTLMLEVYYRYLPMYAQPSAIDAIGMIRGVVTDSATGERLGGAIVRLDLPDGRPVTAESKADGSYALAPPEVPDFFALSASREGYVPEAVNVATSMVMGTTLQLDFRLEPMNRSVVAIEAVPEVHHLGDDAFSGSINSRFQKSAEGSVFTAEFTVEGAHIEASAGTATLSLLAKGVQASHRILINGKLLPSRLDESPRDGSFGEFTAEFSTRLLTPGTNRLRILATSLGSDVDDFEFVNIRIHFER